MPSKHIPVTQWDDAVNAHKAKQAEKPHAV